MDLKGLLAVAGEMSGLLGRLQQGSELRFEVIEAHHLHGSAMTQEKLDERGEVFHVRPKKHRFAGEDGLRWILTPFGQEAFSDDNERGEVLPSGEFAGGINEQASPVIDACAFL